MNSPTSTSDEIVALNTSHLITEDDEPVDNILSEKQMRLLTEPLYTSWKPGRPFLAAANVGVFAALNRPPVVPDVFVSLDVTVGSDWWAQENRSYFLWEHGKAPDVVVEIVSNKKGGELDRKWKEYCRIGVPHYVVYDPACQIQDGELAYYQLQGGVYQKSEPIAFSGLDLRLCMWSGTFEGTGDRWLRWADGDGNVLLTGAELAEEERQRADQEAQRANHEAQRANHEAQRANHEAQRAEALAGKLRAMGIDPDADLG